VKPAEAAEWKQSTRHGRYEPEPAGVGMELEVQCDSGGKADERPVSFRLRGRLFFVEEILDQWYGPDDSFFKLRADDGNLYILRRSRGAPEGIWSLEAFRSER
jgi:hypothetical protein